MKIKLDAHFRTNPKVIPAWIKQLYLHVLKGKLNMNQMRFFFYADGVPFISTICPTNGAWGEEFTVQEFINLVHERLKNGQVET